MLIQRSDAAISRLMLTIEGELPIFLDNLFLKRKFRIAHTAIMMKLRKPLRKILALMTLAIGATIVLPSYAQTPAPRKRTVWVDPPTGSLLGGGYVDAGDPQPATRSTSPTAPVAEKSDFRVALANFNAQAGTVVEGWSLIVPAVSWQTGVPVETVKKQRAATGLSFGELLVADSLASGSGKSFNEIVALKARGQGWSQVAKQCNINIDSITARLRTAGDSIKYAQSRRNKHREQNLRDSLTQAEQKLQHPGD